MSSIVHVWIAGAIGAFGLLTALGHLAARRSFHAFLIVWTVLSFLIYSYAGEKIPWVATHITLPLLLWAGLEASLLAREVAAKWGRPGRAVCLAGGLIVVGWSAFNGVRAAFLYPSNPRERLVYNHTTATFKAASDFAADLIERARKIEGLEDAAIRYQGSPGWPIAFDVRNLKGSGELGKNLDKNDIFFVDQLPAFSSISITDEFEYIDVPFRQFYAPQMLPIPRMVGFSSWMPSANEQKRLHYIYERGEKFGEWNPLEILTPVGGREAWRMLARYYFLREPFYDPSNPHGYWGAGPTAQVAITGVSKELLEKVAGARSEWNELRGRITLSRRVENWDHLN